jgi:hypothetical protein
MEEVVAAKEVIRGVAGVAALGYAGRELVKSRRPQVLGMKLPAQLAPRNLDTKKLAKQVSKLADQLERASDDVRIASAQVGRVAKKVS